MLILSLTQAAQDGLTQATHDGFKPLNPNPNPGYYHLPKARVESCNATTRRDVCGEGTYHKRLAREDGLLCKMTIPYPTISKIEKVPRGIQVEKSSKDMASSGNLVSTIGTQAYSIKWGGAEPGVWKGKRSLLEDYAYLNEFCHLELPATRNYIRLYLNFNFAFKFDFPKSVRNRCVIEVFGGVFYVVTLLFGFFVSEGAFVIGLGQISSLFSFT